jgi:GTPase Era involved in 16S rRNA processing
MILIIKKLKLIHMEDKYYYQQKLMNKRYQRDESIENEPSNKRQKTNNIEEKTIFEIIERLIRLGAKHIMINLNNNFHLVTVGDQNSGKTTVLNRFIGEHLLPVRDSQTIGAKSLCPTSIHTIKSEEGITASASIDGILKGTQSCNKISDLSTYICKWTDTTQKGFDNGNFSRNIIELKLSAPTLTDMHFVDLPGMINNDPHLCTFIRDIIISHLKQNSSSIVLFVARAGDLRVTSSWQFINCLPNKDNVLLLITRPDSLGVNDETQLKYIDGRDNLGIPLSNIFIVKNQDTCNQQALNIPESHNEEIEWFQRHEQYKKYINNNTYKNNFGIAAARNRLIQKLKEKIHTNLPKILDDCKKRSIQLQEERCRLGQKLLLDDMSKMHTYYKCINQVKDYINKVIKGEIQSTRKIRIKELLGDFNKAIASITYNKNMTDAQIETAKNKIGAIENDPFGPAGYILLNIVIFSEESPFSELKKVIKKYSEEIYAQFCAIISDMNFEDNLHPHFWSEMKRVIIESFDNAKLTCSFEDFCAVQKYYFGDDSKRDTDDTESPTCTIIKNFWKGLLGNISTNFSKFVREHMINYNIEKLDTILGKNKKLMNLIKEPEDIETRRNQYDEQIKELHEFKDYVEGVMDKF